MLPLISRWPSIRTKIEAIVKKPGVPDEDCPDDAASTRWWCSVGGKYTGRESMTIAMTASSNVAPSAETLGGLIGDAAPANGGVLALTNGPDASGAACGGHSLQALVGVMNNQIAAKAKAKGKAKAKAKANPNPANANTPDQVRESHRFLL